MLLFFLQREVSAEIEEQLELQSLMVSDEIAQGKAIHFPLVQITTGNEALLQQARIFKDTLIYDRIQDKNEGYYSLSDTRTINGKDYRIRVMTSHIGLDGYSKAVGYIFIAMAGMFIFLGSLMNYFVNRKVWQPFLINLQRLKSYSVSSNEDLMLDSSNISEFKEMNAVLQELADKARREYSALKEFTANASHEIQTPLSIIQSRLESISQLELLPDLARYVMDAKRATNRLSKVNKGLLLLAKLENNDFPDKQSVDLKDFLNAQIDQTEDLLIHKGFIVTREIGLKEVEASLFLLEILISNLLSNILAHSSPNARVSISLDSNRMIFSNEGQRLNFSESKLFSRFGKGADNYTGNGLGLSIINQICIVNGWDIKYDYNEDMHLFEIRFSDSLSKS
ncbi:MAG: HAMP domain-containing sensor histidine kinase [Daejeonella sp.]